SRASPPLQPPRAHPSHTRAMSQNHAAPFDANRARANRGSSIVAVWISFISIPPPEQSVRNLGQAWDPTRDPIWGARPSRDGTFSPKDAGSSGAGLRRVAHQVRG